MAVNERIRDIRKRNGMSQLEFGKLLGVSNSTVSEWESGNRGVPIDAIDQIAKALNVSVPYLMDWAEDADALAPTNALSSDALHVARIYDSLDPPGQELLTWIADHEAARVAASNEKSHKRLTDEEAIALAQERYGYLFDRHDDDEFDIARRAIDELNAADSDKPAAG